MQKRIAVGILVALLLALFGIERAETSPQPGSQTIVYITRTGVRYHRDGCRSLLRSRIPIPLQQAQARGYTPCRICKPPAMAPR
jgi:hypothetical protein